MEPYSTNSIIEATLRRCCGNCVNVSTGSTHANITEVLPSSINSSDFITPFLGSSTDATLYGFHFIPVVYVPNAFYITQKRKPILTRLVASSLHIYAFIVICLLMAIISGFIAWLMETWFNREHFPRPFLIGWFEGFWWSFISMTTVGYGDRIPKSIPARIFSVLWILIGVALFDILTGLITTALINVNSPQTPIMSGRTVGSLKFREYDASLISMHGGTVIETRGENFYSDIKQLIYMLRNNIVHGILLDKYTFSHVVEMFLNGDKAQRNDTLKNHVGGDLKQSYMTVGTDLQSDIEFFMSNTILTEKSYGGEKLSYGFLAKYHVDYEYIYNAVINNRLPLETEMALRMANQFKRFDVQHVLNHHEVDLVEFIKLMGYMLAAICMFGTSYEVCRRCKECISKKQASAVHPAASITFG